MQYISREPEDEIIVRDLGPLGPLLLILWFKPNFDTGLRDLRLGSHALILQDADNSKNWIRDE